MRTFIIATLLLASTVRSAETNDVLAVMKKVADWQLTHPSSHPPTEWTQGAGYAGMMALASLSDVPKYHDAMIAMSRTNHWAPRDPKDAEIQMAARAAAAGRSTNTARAADLLYHADEQCVLQTYLDLYLKHRDPQMLAPAKERLDKILADPRDDNLVYTNRGASSKWSWCDALFMAPPVWARLTAATGNRAYLDFMNHNWWATSNYLYDKTEHLYYRDSRFFDKHEANGKKVFWCRGNGWVMAGVARVLQFMPADYPDRPKYVAQLKEMSAALVKLQGKGGLWNPSLLDPESYPTPDSSGSGLIVYGLAYGVNHKILDCPAYEPPILKGWQGLLKCVDETGKLGFVQPVGYQPVEFGSTNTDVYGVGAFLLAGSEVYRMTSTNQIGH
jgi:unsaturated rhamnogalacturonyl hydrolase